MAKTSALRTISVSLISVYRAFVSPLLGDCCRFTPSCSDYTQQAILGFGIWRGCYLGLKRILRCHPFCCGGVDPLPSIPQEK